MPDPGYAKVLHLIDDARSAGVDRVNLATYQTVLGTAPPLAAVIDPAARDADDEVADDVIEVQHSPNRDDLVNYLAIQDVIRAAAGMKNASGLDVDAPGRRVQRGVDQRGLEVIGSR